METTNKPNLTISEPIIRDIINFLPYLKFYQIKINRGLLIYNRIRRFNWKISIFNDINENSIEKASYYIIMNSYLNQANIFNNLSLFNYNIHSDFKQITTDFFTLEYKEIPPTEYKEPIGYIFNKMDEKTLIILIIKIEEEVHKFKLLSKNVQKKYNQFQIFNQDEINIIDCYINLIRNGNYTEDKILFDNIIKSLMDRTFFSNISKDIINNSNIENMLTLNKKDNIIEFEGLAISSTHLRVFMDTVKENEHFKGINLSSTKHENLLNASKYAFTNKNFFEVILKNNNINDENIKEYFVPLDSLSQIQCLDLSNNSIVSEPALETLNEFLKSSTKLNNLNLSNNSITGHNLLEKIILENSSLKVLTLNKSVQTIDSIRSISTALSSENSLKRLFLNYNQIGKEGAELLSQALTVNKCLIELCLKSNSLQVEGMIALSNGLSANKTLKILDVSYNFIKNEGMKFLSEAFEKGSRIEKLIVSSNGINKDGTIYISNILSSSPCLRSLELGLNQLGVEGVTELSQSLVNNCILEELDLSCNQIKSSGITNICEVISKNYTLKKLALCENNIDNDGVAKICESFHYNNSIQLLDLKSNKIGNAGVKSLLGILSKSRNLKVINIRSNKIKIEGFKMIKSFLVDNDYMIVYYL